MAACAPFRRPVRRARPPLVAPSGSGTLSPLAVSITGLVTGFGSLTVTGGQPVGRRSDARPHLCFGQTQPEVATTDGAEEVRGFAATRRHRGGRWSE